MGAVLRQLLRHLAGQTTHGRIVQRRGDECIFLRPLTLDFACLSLDLARVTRLYLDLRGDRRVAHAWPDAG